MCHTKHYEIRAMSLLKGNSGHRIDAPLGVASTTNDISTNYLVDFINHNTFPILYLDMVDQHWLGDIAYIS